MAAAAKIPETVKNLYSDDVIRATLATLAIRATVPVEEQLGLRLQRTKTTVETIVIDHLEMPSAN